MMRKVLGSTMLCAALVGGLAMPAPSTAVGRPMADEVEGPATSVLTSSALTPVAAAALRPRLVKGAQGAAVVFVQQALTVTPTSGYYGPLTRRAVKKFQKLNNLRPTGRVTAKTWAALLPTTTPSTTPEAAPTPQAAAALRPTLEKGNRGPAVVFVQQALAVTPTSGYYGPLTRRAVKKYQKLNSLKRTGRVTARTWAALLSGDADTTPTTPVTADPSPEPAPLSPAQAAADRPTLSRGMGPGHPAVVFVQQYLRVSPDSGFYGTLTTAAVTAYQRGLSLKVTGTVDGPTWDAIHAGRTVSAPAPTQSQSPNPTATPTYKLPADPAARDRALVFALAQVGKPYVLGGNGPDVFDCSGLIQQAYLAAGVSLPRLASQQRFAGTRVELDDLVPGDLLYYQDGTSPRSGHISMYAGNGLAVEAANPRRGVRVRDLHEPWYRDRFVAATRVG